jgi:hypothetical protein
LLTVLLGFTGPQASAQHGDDTGFETFPAVDPHTRGERELLDRLGYVSFGPFPWAGADRTTDVAQILGGIDVLWVETEHFKLGSSLGTYEIPNDREERGLIEGDLKRLKQRLGRLKPEKKSLDPWLRLHLYAQRLEELYGEYSSRFGLGPEDFDEGAPYLGQERKFLVLLCERKSNWGRYARRYIGAENDHSYRFSQPDAGVFFGGNAEVLRESGYGLDSALWCTVASGVVSNFVDAHRSNGFQTPAWWRYGLAHWYARRIDPRFLTAIGQKPGDAQGEEDWIWEPRVHKLVSNGFFPKSEEMITWRRYEELDSFAHLVVWSRVDFLFALAEEGRVDLGAFHDAICLPPPPGTSTEEALRALQIENQTRAFSEHLKLTPAALDEAWAKYVKKQYDTR